MFMRHDTRGISMIEVIVAIGIFLLVIGAIIEVFLFSFRSKDIIFEQLAAQGQGRRVVQDFINELRSATYSSIGAYPISQASSTQITFYSNIDKDSNVEKIRYFLSSTTLQRGVTEPSGNPLTYVTSSEITATLVESVNTSSTIFKYYDQSYAGSGSSLTQPLSISDVRMVELILTLDRDPFKSPVPIQVQAKTALRNLKSN